MAIYSNRIVISIGKTGANSQSIPTQTGLQVMWQVSVSTLQTYFPWLNSSLSNLRFVYNGQFVPAWLESINNGIATIWIKMPVSIPANSSIILNLYSNSTLNFDGVYRGEAPQLSPTYGQYDNGANVFLLYFNGNTPLSNFNSERNTLTQASVTGPTGATINVISITGYASNFGFVYTAKSLTNQPIVAESSSKQAGNQAGGLGADNGQVSIVDRTSTSGLNAISVDMGWGSSYFTNDYFINGSQTFDVNQQGSANTNWHYASVTYSGSSDTSWSGYIAPQLYSTTGGYSGTVSNNPLSSSSTLYLGLIGDVLSGDQWQTYINWMRARAYPPNGVMPTVGLM
jgi:hypothetical protein